VFYVSSLPEVGASDQSRVSDWRHVEPQQRSAQRIRQGLCRFWRGRRGGCWARLAVK
jgi:hypothetical protein